MPEEQVVKQEEVNQEEVKQEDLVTRVSQIKTSTEAKQEIDEKFNINDLDAHIEKLPDPALKEQVLGLKKSLLRGENQKYQEIANLRKQYEQELSKLSTWTPERVQGLLQNQDFVKAAQAVTGTNRSEESMLSESERAKIEQAQQLAKEAQAQLFQIQQQQVHSSLKTKYANYDPETVNTDINQLLSGKVGNDVFIESAWKARDYENAVKRAYQLGLMDKNTQNQERVKGMTFVTGANMVQPTGVERQKGEPISQFLARSYSEHVKKK